MARRAVHITITDRDGQLRLDATLDANAHLSYKKQPQPKDILGLSPWASVAMELTFVDGSTSPNLKWTAEGFQEFLVFDNKLLMLQFKQRCFLSETGYTFWRFRLSGLNDQAAEYGAAPEELNALNESWRGIPLPELSNGISFIVSQEMPDGNDYDWAKQHQATKTNVWELRESAGVAAELYGADQSFLVYRADQVQALSRNQPAGNGLVLEGASQDPDTTLWQGCAYTVLPQSTSADSIARVIPVGVTGLSSKTVLDSWRTNVAHRYYEGLAQDHNFSLMPELYLAQTNNPQQIWQIRLQVQDSLPLGVAPSKWNWKAEDDTTEYPSDPPRPNILFTRLRWVRMLDNATESVYASFGAFRGQDSKPIEFSTLTLAPPQDDDKSTVWRMRLTGYVDSKASTPIGSDHAGNRLEQEVRAGSFSLQLLPCIANQTSDQIELDVQASFGIASKTTSPIMPIVTVTLKPLAIWDATPAGEDELNADEYAQLNIGTPNQNAGYVQSVRELLNQIYRNMQRDQSVVFPRPTKGVSRATDGTWYLQYSEQSSLTEKLFVSMQLRFTPKNSGQDNYQSVLVFNRNPYTFADVHFHPLTGLQPDGGTVVADWNSLSSEWRIVQFANSPSYMVFPPQIVGEEAVSSSTSIPQGLNDGKQTQMAVGMPAVITFANQSRTASDKVPWDLQRLTTDSSLKVSRIDYEMLYGMAGTTTADHMRLTEAAALYGNLLGEFPPLDVPKQNDPRYEVLFRYLLARVHWSRIHREYRSRLGVYVLQDSSSSDPETFVDTANTTAWLRLDSTNVISNPATPSDQFIGASLVPHSLPDGGTSSFQGGALIGVTDPDIYTAIVTVNNGRTPQKNAAVINPRFSAEGGFGTVRGAFNYGKTTLSNADSMGRTVTYTVEQIGRIGCHWNRAKHVVVYERTVVPSRQFYIDQSSVPFRGMPLVRKVEEYVEFIESERIFATESTAPQAAFARGFKCGDRTRISVDSAWGSVVIGQGWKVPLWNVDAGLNSPDVYPKPQFYLEVATPEQTLDSTEQRASFLTMDALLTHPEEVVFYTSYVETNADTDTWRPVETVDCVGYSLLGPDTDAYGNDGDLTKVALPEFATPPGWDAVTFRIAPPAVGVSVTAGVVNTSTPVAAQLTKITVNRGPLPTVTTVREILTPGTPEWNTYAGSDGKSGAAFNVATIPQAFTAMCAAITVELAAPNSTQTQGLLSAQKQRLNDAVSGLQCQVTGVASGLQKKITDPYTDVAKKLVLQINGDIAQVQTILQTLLADMNWPKSSSTKPSDACLAAINHLRQTFAAIENTAFAWPDTAATRITGIVRTWSNELEMMLATYAGSINQPVNAFSPLRQLSVALGDFENEVTGIEADIDQLLKAVGTASSDFALEVQDFENRFNAAVSHLTAGLNTLQRIAVSRGIDPSLVLLLFHTTGLAAEFEVAVAAAMQAASSGAQDDADAAKSALQTLRSNLGGINQNLTDATTLLDESVLDILRQVPVVQALYNSKTLKDLQDAVLKICESPKTLIQPLHDKVDAYLNKIAATTLTALTGIAQDVANWLVTQSTPLAAQLNNFLTDLTKLDVSQEFAALQGKLGDLEGQYRGAVQQVGQYVDQYVRQPLLDTYKALAQTDDKALRMLKAFGAPPQVPNLDLQPAAVGYLYAGISSKVPVTAMLARANQVGQALNALGVQLPTTALAEALIPATLKNFNLTDVLPNFAGLQLPGLFSGIKLPDIDEKNVTITHGWEPQSRRAWLQADVNIPFTDRMVVFDAGFVSFVLTGATFVAQSRVQNAGTSIQQSTQGSITGTWNVEIGDSSALISFASTTLAFDDHGKFQFQFRPDHLKLSDALKAITALLKSFSDPDSGFAYGATPTGVKCAFTLPVPDTSALTSGFSGLSFSASLELAFANDFQIILALGVSSKDRPFNFAIFILGGCGYVLARIVYNVSKGSFGPPSIDLAIGCSASLAIALGPISGGVYAQFAIELRNNGGGLRAGAFFQIIGHVSICGLVSVDLVFRLEATYSDSVMIASGHFSYSISVFMFSFSISRDVTMQLGRGGQRSGRMVRPEPFAIPYGRPQQNEVASLARPEGAMAGLGYAFSGAEPVLEETLAGRYVRLLL